MASSLSDLVYLICSGEFVSEQTISARLDAAYPYSQPLAEGVERLLCERGFKEGIEHLFLDSSEALISLARRANSSCPARIGPKDAIQILLQGLKLAPSAQVKYSLGAHLIAEKIRQAIREFERLVKTESLDREDFRRKPLNAWSYAEHVLKSAINFYTSILLRIDSSVDDVFEEARNKHSLGPILNAMRDIEEQFLSVESRSKKSKDKSKKQIFNDPRELIRECQRLYGRNSPFAGFRVWPHLNILKAYRNFFAHTMSEIIDDVSLELFRNSLKAADSLVGELIELNIAPSVIYVTAHGWDEYGRGIVWFVDEEYVTLNATDRRKEERRMFKPNPDEWEKLKPYMTVTWPKDLMFDPPLVPLHIEEGVLPNAAV